MIRQTSHSMIGKRDRRGPRGTPAKQSGATGKKSRSGAQRDVGSLASRRWFTGHRIARLTAGRFRHGIAGVSVA